MEKSNGSVQKDIRKEVSNILRASNASRNILAISDSILRPRLKRTSIIAAIPVFIFLVDLLTGYCTEDMCFSGIHRISGDRYYFLFANIEFFIIKALLGFVVISLIYGGIRHLVRISRKRQTRKD